MKKTWNRITSTLALAAFLAVGCGREAAPVDQRAAGNATPVLDASGAHSDDDHDHAGHSHGAESDREPVHSGHDDDAQRSGGLDVLDTGVDVSGIQIDLGDGASTATPRANGESPPVDRGLQKAVPRYLGGISFDEGEKPVHSFGNVREGESREKNFRFVSDGKEDLVIKTIKPSCGCTKAEIELLDDQGGVATQYVRGDPIPVGQKFRLLTEMSLEDKHGHVEASVGLISNDPEGAVNVRLTAEVERVLVMEPDLSALYFGDMSVLDQAEKKTRVTTTRGEKFRLGVDDTTPLPESIHVTFDPVDPDGEGRSSAWDVTITMGPGLDEGIRHYPLYLKSDIEVPNPKYPNEDGSPKFFLVPLALQVKVAGLVSARPGYIGFGLVRPGQVHERTISIECADDFVLSPDSEVILEGLYGGESPYPDSFEIKLEALPVESDVNGLALTLKLLGMADDFRGSFGGRLRVVINHPGKEELLLRFSGICRAGLPGTTGN